VVRRPGSALTEEALLAYLRSQLAGYKIPKSVVFVEELPKTGAGKIDKNALRQRYGG
jgi:fatty-acyl-CoA synthase